MQTKLVPNMRNKPIKFYEEHWGKCVELIASMEKEGWTIEQVVHYFWCLDYDNTFLKRVKLYMINKNDDNSNRRFNI